MKMMIEVAVVIFIAYIFGFFIKGKSRETYEPWNRNNTNALKGFSILTVLFSHTGAEIGVENIQFIAAVGVSIFLILSGYGLTCSFQNNGTKGFISKKMKRIVLPFYVFSFIFSVLTRKLTLERLLNIFLFQTGWYMWYMLIWYVIFFIIMILLEKQIYGEKTAVTLFFVVGVVWLIIDSLFFAKPGAESLHAREMFAFPIGVLLGFYKRIKEKISQSIYGGISLIVIGLVITGLLEMKLNNVLPIIICNAISLISVVPVALGVIILSFWTKKLWNNSFLIILGICSYEIYITQMYTRYLIGSMPEYTLLILVSICALAYVESNLTKAVIVSSKKGVQG